MLSKNTIKKKETLKEFYMTRDIINEEVNRIDNQLIHCSEKKQESQEIHILNMLNNLATHFSIEKLEYFENNLRLFDFNKNLDDLMLIEILKTLDKECNRNILLQCKGHIVTFLIRLMYKKTKLDIGTKSLAYEILKKIGFRDYYELFIFDLPYITNFKNIKSKFIMDFYNSVDNKNDLFEILFKSNNFKKYEKIMKGLIHYDNMTFVIALIEFIIVDDTRKEGISVLFDAFELLMEYLYRNKERRSTQMTEISQDTIKTYIKKTFSFLIMNVISKKNKLRYQIARHLLRMNLRNVVFNKAKLVKLCNKLLKDKSITIYELGVFILSIIKRDIIIGLLECEEYNKVKVIFKYLGKYDDALVYKKYLELKNNSMTRDVNIKIHNMLLFAKIYYNFYNKDVIKYIPLEFDEITGNIYLLDLILNYSKYFPEKINSIFISSLLFEEQTNILRNIKIIEILTNIYLDNDLKRILSEFFHTLILQSPYIKCIGNFFNVHKEYAIKEIPNTEYKLVIYGSLNHPHFKKLFNEYDWSVNKERALIYYLEYNPELSLVYKNKLTEILCRDFSNKNMCDMRYKYNLLELLNLLTKFIDNTLNDEITNFLYKFVIEHRDQLYELIQLIDLSIKIQAFKFILKCTNQKILIKEESIPYLVVYHKYDDSLYLYKDLIVKDIVNIILKRCEAYLKNRKLYDECFIKNILKEIPDDLINEVWDKCEDNMDLYKMVFFVFYLNLDKKILDYDVLIDKDEVDAILDCNDKNDIFNLLNDENN